VNSLKQKLDDLSRTKIALAASA